MENMHTNRQATSGYNSLYGPLNLPVSLCVCFPLLNPATLHAAQVRSLVFAFVRHTAAGRLCGRGGRHDTTLRFPCQLVSRKWCNLGLSCDFLSRYTWIATCSLQDPSHIPSRMGK